MKNLPALFVAMGLWSVSASAMTFVHPGALNSKAELDFVKAKIQAGAQP
jgi:5,10-methylenetetrahydrofolate reductase